MNDQRKLFLEMKSAPMKIQLTLLKWYSGFSIWRKFSW
jgi:hypothetical protein